MEGFYTNLDIFIFVKTKSCFSQPSVLLEALLTKATNLSEEEQKKLKQFCQVYLCVLHRNWKSCNRTIHTFVKKYETWLEKEIKWPNFIKDRFVQSEEIGLVSTDSVTDTVVPSTSSASGINEGASTSKVTTCTVSTTTTLQRSPRKPFSELCQKQKKRRIEELLTHDSQELAYAAAASCGEKNEDVKDLIKYITEHPEKAADIKNFLKGKAIINKYSAEKALGILISLKLSKWQYITLRETAKESGVDLYPSYYAVLNAKKACYPPESDIKVTEQGVKVKLQAILDITVTRLAKTLNLDHLQDKELILICKWGFDGASNQSNYKQCMNVGEDDSSVFMCSFVPLQLMCGDDLVWENPKPSSTMLCRPIYFKFVSENKLDMKEEMGLIDAEIEALKPSIIENNIQVKHSMLMTMIDGKITSHLSQTSMQTCDICKAVPSEMNDLEKIHM